ncbi:MAG: amidohydrolase [Erysipelotrichaceae bacterium]|nr:amidohydrolase [Erysipelotrichaceae bacterium]
MLIKNGNLFTMEKEGTFVGDLLLENGKIKKIGKDLSAPDAKVIDATGKNVYPGLVEAHCHMGLHEAIVRYEGNDTNEATDPITPQLRAIDGIYPGDAAIPVACAGGVTTVCAGPGSANVLGGTFFAYKTYGTAIDKMVIKEDVAMKAAFGENPKFCYQNSKIQTRMMTAALLREILFKTREYVNKKEAAKDDISKLPAYDMKLEAMIPVLKGIMPLKAHAHRSDDILTVIRIAKEFNLKVTLDHCTDGHLIADEVKASGFPAIVGPSMTSKSKYELRFRTFETPGILNRAGVKIAITTDSPVLPQENLPLCAGLAVKYGLDHQEALKAITINPAEIIGVSDRVGSLKVGKDGDVIITDGDILLSSTFVLCTIIDGSIVYDRQEAC